MKVLITGATGFVGSHVAAATQAAGHDARLLVRGTAKAIRVLDMVGVVSNDVVVGDVTDADSLSAAVEGCDAVVHPAAMVALHLSQAAEAHAVNTRATALVLGAAARAGLDPIVHVSSVSVFQQHRGVVSLESPLRVGASGYSASKVDSEWMARGMQAAGIPVVTVYPSGIIGPQAPSLTVVHTAAQTWIRAMPMITSGINMIDVRDLAAMIVAALEPGRGPWRLMAGGIYTPWAELVTLIEAKRGRRIPRYPAPGTRYPVPGMRGSAASLTSRMCACPSTSSSPTRQWSKPEVQSRATPTRPTLSSASSRARSRSHSSTPIDGWSKSERSIQERSVRWPPTDAFQCECESERTTVPEWQDPTLGVSCVRYRR